MNCPNDLIQPHKKVGSLEPLEGYEECAWKCLECASVFARFRVEEDGEEIVAIALHPSLPRRSSGKQLLDNLLQ